MPPKKIIIEVDSREHYPLLFPATVDLWNGRGHKRILVEAVRTKLDAGDYRIQGHGDLVVVERKGSASELSKNLTTKDQARQARALRRLVASTKNAYVLIECTPYDLLVASRLNPAPDKTIQRLAALAVKFPLHLVCIGKSTSNPARRKVGEFVLHLMLGHVKEVWT